ncbi:PREDICTED: ELL-associated factor 1-like isoform X1 [Branchiostoma belcheri]|uniref:ELL-associated factor 1-like isoform X1 n=1 Tax=Branchiostoma belcheri TaxID=7741 RepID=A0A6P5AIB8_BRABE|nr:PREDICTED: ELL-associated factor 1-like isoform X1 [Branchiostoma belcheri]
MAEPRGGLVLDDKVHELEIGKSFDRTPKCAFHTIRYDFKPASVDTSQDAVLEVGENNDVTVTVPHIEGSGTSKTVFKGHKQPYRSKDCVLLIDPNSGTFTLEKLTSNMQVKKTRLEGKSKQLPAGLRPSTPNQASSSHPPPPSSTNPPPSKTARKESPPDSPLQTLSSPEQAASSPFTRIPDADGAEDSGSEDEKGQSSSSSSSSGSDSDSESGKDGDSQPAKKEGPDKTTSGSHHQHKPPVFMSQLCEDLELSESDSD